MSGNLHHWRLYPHKLISIKIPTDYQNHAGLLCLYQIKLEGHPLINSRDQNIWCMSTPWHRASCGGRFFFSGLLSHIIIILLTSLQFRFIIQGKFWLSGIVVACVFVSVRPSVDQSRTCPCSLLIGWGVESNHLKYIYYLVLNNDLGSRVYMGV